MRPKNSPLNWPLIRGVVGFFDSQVTGVKSLMHSADLVPEEAQEAPSKFDLWLEKKLGNEKFQQALIGSAVFMGLGLSILLFMLIPMFLLKEEPTNKPAPVREGEVAEKPLTLWRAIAVSLKNKNFIYWMTTAAVMNFGLQLFLGGINELFSSAGLNMTVVMASSFVPVPLTIILYNKIVSKRGLGFGYRYILTIFSILTILAVSAMIDAN